MLIAFELSMPSNNSWNGRWSGAGSCYAKVIDVGSSKKAQTKFGKIIADGPYRYNFGDGWCAQVSVRAVDSAEARKLRKASRGFCGYEWMIESIRYHGEILNDNQRRERARAVQTVPA